MLFETVLSIDQHNQIVRINQSRLIAVGHDWTTGLDWKVLGLTINDARVGWIVRHDSFQLTNFQSQHFHMPLSLDEAKTTAELQSSKRKAKERIVDLTAAFSHDWIFQILIRINRNHSSTLVFIHTCGEWLAGYIQITCFSLSSFPFHLKFLCCVPYRSLNRLSLIVRVRSQHHKAIS